MIKKLLNKIFRSKPKVDVCVNTQKDISHPFIRPLTLNGETPEQYAQNMRDMREFYKNILPCSSKDVDSITSNYSPSPFKKLTAEHEKN